MKKKSVFSIILALLLVVLTCATLAACNPQNNKPTTYTVTFTNGDTVVETLTGIAAGTQLTAEQIPTLENVPDDKEFKGWYVGEGTSAVKVEAGYTVNSDVTAVARIKDKTDVETFTVTFKNGDTVVDELTDIEEGSQLTAEQIPTLENVPDDKEFKGWYVGEGENAVKVEAGYTVNGDVTAVARLDDKQVDPNICTVTFEGEGVTTPSQPVEKGDTALEPNDPDRGPFWQFDGWYLDGVKYDFDTPVTEDITLVAQWTEIEPTSMTGTGTKDDPYVLWSANDVLNFSSRVNNPSTEGNEGYYNAYYRLGKDIDMEGVLNYAPAGVRKAYSDENGDEITVNGFEGVFDGNGHKIINLEITRNLRSGLSNVGFFGITHKAAIKNITFENIHFVAESGADVNTIGAYYGGVVGYASLTNFFGVKVTGTIEARLFSSNVASIGGIAGYWDAYDSEKAYIAFTENCYVDVNIISGSFSDFDGETSLVGALVGGLHGSIDNTGSTVALINCATSGTIEGGQCVGGLAASLDSNAVSIINCASNMSVRATATNSSSFAGGFIGYTRNDVIIIDSVFFGSVRGSKPASNNGYAGALVGYASADNYNLYYSPGIAVVNSYYKAKMRDVQNRTTLGTELSEEPTLEWAIETLGWDTESWSEGFIPTDVFASDLRSSATLTFANGNQKTNDEREIKGLGGYPVVGIMNGLSSSGGNVFYDWELANGAFYRYYMPLVKDVTLTARWHNVSEIVGIYSGTYDYHVVGEAGLIQLKEDGTCQWIMSGPVNGVYRYDGTHIVFTFFNAYEEVSGTLANGSIRFTIAHGGTGEVDYTFVKTDLRYFGEYYSEDGDCIAFGGENRVTVNSISIGTDFYNATFVEEGNTLTLTSAFLSAIYSSMTITVNEDLSLTVNFVGKDPAKSINKVFGKLGTPDYTGKAFVGNYAFSYLSTGDDLYQMLYKIRLNADGTASLISANYETLGLYYAFGNVIRLSLESNMSTFTFDENAQILHGVCNRGTVRNTILIKLDSDVEVKDLNIRAFAIDKDINDVVYLLGDRKYLMKDGVWKQNAVITGSFDNDGRVTIDGVDYLANHSLYNQNMDLRIYSLGTIGAEAGTYTREGRTLVLNGVGVVSGDIGGSYRMYGNLVSVLLDDDTVFGFDYTAAQAANNVITDKEHDGYQGVWYMDKTVSIYEWLEDGTQADKPTSKLIEKYYKFAVDGFGHTTIIYYSNDYREYRYNWGAGTGWGTYTVTATGIHTYYNEYQSADVVFYYDMCLAYSRSFGSIGESSFYKDGYTGVMTPPSLPAGLAGSYTGAEASGTAVVFNLRADLTGTYKGVPFISVYDGTSKVNFSINGVNYAFDTATKVIKYGSEEVALTRAGEITEVIPASLCGDWSGLLTGYGLNPDGELRTITLNSDGTLIYEEKEFAASYDAFEQVITASGSAGGTGYTFELKIVEADNTIKVEIRRSSGDSEFTDTGTFAKE